MISQRKFKSVWGFLFIQKMNRLQAATNEMSMLNFLIPFSSSMWVSIGIAYIMVSLMMFFVGRLSPYERYSQCLSEGNIRNKYL